MKTLRVALATTCTIAAALFAFNVMIGGSVKGTIVPAEGGVKAWAISDTDTFNTSISNGTFEIGNVNPGTYNVVIEAKAPYKNALMQVVEVKESEAINIGEIKLEQ
ncbi:MAG: hypothetical protein KF862_13270 [Chitinophagaceae bacterium]|nr:hypothetical protein [Chitinophagaceae bacterium]